jgi:hypothetical protein
VRSTTSNDVTENDVHPHAEWMHIAATYPRTVAVIVVLMLVACAVIALPLQ